MTNETKYGIRKAKERNLLPSIDLIVVPHRGKDLSVALFGPDAYKKNKEAMKREYWHSNSHPNISFTPARTSESISAAAYDFENEAKPKIFDSRWLQIGNIVRTQDGVFTNTLITDEKDLNEILNGIKKVNGIYLLDNEIGFAPYESFEIGIQDCGNFVRGGLARALEHTPKKTAKNLGIIASSKFYPNGINLFGFDKVKEPILGVASLGSDRSWNIGDRLNVDGNGWSDGSGGHAFGVCAPEKRN